MLIYVATVNECGELRQLRRESRAQEGYSLITRGVYGVFKISYVNVQNFNCFPKWIIVMWSLLESVKSSLTNNFAMKDLGEATHILGIKIYRDRSRRQMRKICQKDNFNWKLWSCNNLPPLLMLNQGKLYTYICITICWVGGGWIQHYMLCTINKYELHIMPTKNDVT